MEKPSLEELKRLREAATLGPWHTHGLAIHTNHVTGTGVKHYEVATAAHHDGLAWSPSERLPKAEANSEFIAYAANHAVEIADSLAKQLAAERLHGDLLYEALKTTYLFERPYVGDDALWQKWLRHIGNMEALLATHASLRNGAEREGKSDEHS